MPETAEVALQHDGVRLAWSDGVAALLHPAALRAACRCASCEASRRRGSPPVPDDGVRVADVEPIGGGVVFGFSDGHRRGIYPWSYLRTLCSAPPALREEHA